MRMLLRHQAGEACGETKKGPFGPFRDLQNPVEFCRSISGAGNETQTRDPDLGKVVLYQLSYSRFVLVTGAIV